MLYTPLVSIKDAPMRYAPLAFVLLTGCMTTATDLRERQPQATFHTDKPAAEVVRCLTGHIRNYGQPTVISDGTETSLTFIEGSAAVMVWAITPSGDVRVWRIHGLVPYQEAAQRCL
jgi:hypothetical protein